MATYKSIHTGQQIDAGVSAALNPDTTPTAGSNALMTSGGTKSALNTVDESIAIRVSGNKTTYASGAAIGQYVIVSDSTITGITDGLYKAAKAIPYNTGIDSTYLTAVSGGGMNDLKAAIDSLMVKGYSTTGLSPASGVTLEEGGYYRVGTLVVFCARLSTTNQMSAGALLTGLPGYNTINTAIVACANNRKLDINIQKSGTLYCYDTIPSGALLVSATYIAT